MIQITGFLGVGSMDAVEASNKPITCAQCGQNTPVECTRWLTDMKPYCASCPEVPIRVARVCDTNTREIDFDDVSRGSQGTPHDSVLCLSPTPEYYGLWIRENGALTHQILIRDRDEKALVFTACNQLGQTVCFTVPQTHRAEWYAFCTRFLCVV